MSTLQERLVRLVLIAAIMLSSLGPVQAETLRDTLALAYESNPTIRAERARLKAVRESKAQAWAGALPQIFGAGKL